MRRESLAKWRETDVAGLQQELNELTKQQFRLNMQHAIGEFKEVHKLKNIRKDIARVMTLISEKNR